MNNLRRFFAVVTVLAAPLTLFAGYMGTKSPSSATYHAYVGSYTSKTKSKGIYQLRFDSATGKMSGLEVAAETRDPSWIIVHPGGKYLYAANEAGKASMVSAFAIEPQSGKLTLLNERPALGEDPCHLSFDRTGKFLFVANYTSGNVVVFPIGADGKLGTATANVHDEGTLGPNTQRQEAPHAHWIEPAIDNGSVYVADLGLDRVLQYGFDASKGTLSAGPAGSAWSPSVRDPSAKLSSGTGPRHVAFSSGGMHMYVLGELNSTVTTFHTRGTDDYVPTSFQRISALPEGFSGRNDAAEIALHPSGKFLYSSNRGSDTIAVFNIEQRSGRLSLIANVPTGGTEPRHFAIDPSGNFLLAENQNSHTIVEFRIDQATGKLTPTGETLSVPSPVCLTFVAAE
jgi:6-phosphogluconolactonase